jgi:hypothetical protein
MGKGIEGGRVLVNGGGGREVERGYADGRMDGGGRVLVNGGGSREVEDHSELKRGGGRGRRWRSWVVRRCRESRFTLSTR